MSFTGMFYVGESRFPALQTCSSMNRIESGSSMWRETLCYHVSTNGKSAGKTIHESSRSLADVIFNIASCVDCLPMDASDDGRRVEQRATNDVHL
eukprot:855021-Amphidinium_carterae.1